MQANRKHPKKCPPTQLAAGSFAASSQQLPGCQPGHLAAASWKLAADSWQLRVTDWACGWRQIALPMLGLESGMVQ